jgi:DNA-binding NarL/FixJ family response regulator
MPRWVHGRFMKRILIADDSAVVRRGLRELIERTLDWDVCGEAVNGRDAIKAARELHPDMLLLDLAMPGMNGFDTARELAKIEPNLPILLCTVQLSTYVVREAEKIGIQGAVSKSRVSQITEGIAAVLRHETFYCWPAD